MNQLKKAHRYMNQLKKAHRYMDQQKKLTDIWISLKKLGAYSLKMKQKFCHIIFDLILNVNKNLVIRAVVWNIA